MNESCGCGARIEDAEIGQLREWRTDHRHDAPPLKQSPSGGYASAERAAPRAGFEA